MAHLIQKSKFTEHVNSIKSTKNLENSSENRLLILPTGYIGFLGKRACKALGITAIKAKKTHVKDLLQFALGEEAFLSSTETIDKSKNSEDSIKSQVDPWIQSLRSGRHILLSKDGEEVVFQFDQIVSGVTQLVVASFVEDGKELSKTVESASITEWLEETLISDKPKLEEDKSKETAYLQDNNVKDIVDPHIFLDLSNDFMVTCTLKGLFKSINASFTETLGYNSEDLQTLSFIDIVYPEDRAQIRPILINSANGDISKNQIIDFEARIVSRQGTVIPMEWRLTILDQSLYMVGQDLSARKEHEQIFSHQKDRLSEAQAIGHMGHWTWYMDTHQIEWSDEIYRIFGVERDEFVPTMETINSYLHRQDTGRIMQAFQRAMIEKRDYEMEFAIKRPSGETRYIKCLGRCKLDQEQEVTFLFGIMQDVTEHVQHEHDLKTAKESVERAYAAKSQFLANMSHELRTPLNAIIGFSEMMQRQILGPIGTEKYLDYVDGILESGKHLLDLISDILDMSKIEAGKYELDYEEVNLSDLIQLSVHMIEGRALDNDVKITTTLQSAEIMISVDRRAIMQVLLNVLSNAVKFTKEKGDIKVSCREVSRDNQQNLIEITIEDNGIGIPAMKLNSITNPFEQVSSQYTREHEGSGLGLAITKELIELHSGTLQIKSRVDVGTCVTILLPQSKE